MNPSNTIIDGGYAGKVFFLQHTNGGNLTVDGFTLQNGKSGDFGGGLYIYTDSPSSIGGDVTVTNNAIIGNSAHWGGGIFVYTSSQTSTGGNISAANNIVIANDALNDGGGVYVRSYSLSSTAGDISLSNDIVAENSVGSYGGGVYTESQGTAGNTFLTNNTITGNQAAYGGGLQRFANSLYAYNNIIWGNTATTSGGDIYLRGSGGADGYNNDYSTIGGGSWNNSGSNINADPLFVAVEGNDYHLRPSSPCIDAGLNTAPGMPSTDFEGDLRIIDGNYDGITTVDIGADEYRSYEQCVSTVTDLQNALNTAQSNNKDDMIKVVQGTYMGNFTYSTMSEGHSLILLGGYTANCAGRVVDPTNTILDGGNLDTVLSFYTHTGGDFVIEGFTIQHGNNSGNFGGGIYLDSQSQSDESGTIILNKNIITENSAIGGAGVLAISETQSGTAGTVRLTNNTITHNTATGGDYGGGVYAESFASASGTSGNVDLINNTISQNSSIDYGGGGAYVYTYSDSGIAGTIHITNNTISNNHVTGTGLSHGGGVYVDMSSYNNTGGTVIFAGNTISQNTATGTGGGIYIFSATTTGTTGTMIFANNMITKNTAGTYGGGIGTHLSSSSGNAGTVTLTNNTITENKSASTGTAHGIYINMTGASGGIINVYNNIIWGNTNPSAKDIDLSIGATVTANGYNNDYSVMVGDWDSSNGNINLDPVFVGGGNYHLQYSSPGTSPCIDIGNNLAPELPEIDFDGDPRVVNDTVDIGADEFAGWVVPSTPLDETIYGASTLINEYQPSFHWTVLEPFKSYTLLFSIVENDFTSKGNLITKVNISGKKSSYTPSLGIWKKVMTSSNFNGTIRNIYWRIDGVIGKSTWTGVARHFRIDDLLPAVVQSSGGEDVFSSGTPPTFIFNANSNVKLQLEISSGSDFNPKKMKKFVYTVNDPNLKPSFQKTMSSGQWKSIVTLIGTGTGYFRVRAWDGLKRETVSETRSFTIQ